MKDKRNLAIILGIIGLLLIISVLVVFTFKKDNDTEIDENKKSLEVMLIEFGKDYYENYYFPDLINKEILQEYTESGISINITNLNLIVPLSNDTKKELDKKNCDYDETSIIYYPKKVYGQNDYDIKVQLSCKK